jgi:hypothetical protein
MEFERLGDVKCHIHMLYPANPKIMPWQLVRMLKSITGREVLGGPGLQETVMGRRVFSYGYYVWQWWREEIGGLSNSMPKSQASYGRNFVSFLISNIPWFGQQ